jgi:integrase
MRFSPTVKVITVHRKKQTSYGIEITGAETLGIPARKRIVVSTNKRVAQTYATQVGSDLNHGRLGILIAPAEPIPLKDLVRRYIATKRHHVRASTEKRYANHSEGFLRFTDSMLPEVSLDARRLTGSLVNGFLDFVLDQTDGDENARRQWSRKTVNECLKFMKSVYKFGVAEKLVDRNPFETVALLRVASHGRVEFFSNEDLRRIYADIDSFWLDAIKFLALTGLRKGEMIHLRPNNVSIDVESPFIQIAADDDGEWQPKSGEVRQVPLVPEASEILRRHLGKHPKYVFTGTTNKKIHPDEPYHALKSVLSKLSLDGTIHKLRHTFAAHFLMSGGSLYELKELLGHSNIDTTMIYAHLEKGHLGNKMERFAERMRTAS